MKRTTVLSIISIATLAMGTAVPARSEIQSLTVSVDGLACPFCAYGIEKKLKKLDGVEKLDIGLNTGLVRLDLAEGATPDLSKVRRAVKDAGFTPREIRLTAIGTLSVEGDRVALALRDSEQKFLLFEKDKAGASALSKATHERLMELSGQNAVVAITGTVHEHAEAPAALDLETVQRVHAVSLAVEGMSCSNCAARLSSLLQEAPGVYRASVSFDEKRATVESIGRRIDPAKVVAIVAEAGFKGSVADRGGSR